jgi:hypothetical protein
VNSPVWITQYHRAKAQKQQRNPLARASIDSLSHRNCSVNLPKINRDCSKRLARLVDAAGYGAKSLQYHRLKQETLLPVISSDSEKSLTLPPEISPFGRNDKVCRRSFWKRFNMSKFQEISGNITK